MTSNPLTQYRDGLGDCVCGDPFSSHPDGGTCMRCQIKMIGRSQLPDACRRFEPKEDPRRTYLATSGRVYSPAVGTRITMPGGVFVVAEPCTLPGADVSGEWVCVSHLTVCATTALKDYHCFHPHAPGGGPKQGHLLVWNCYLRTGGRQHGPERAGPPAWHGEDHSGDLPLYGGSSITEQMPGRQD